MDFQQTDDSTTTLRLLSQATTSLDETAETLLAELNERPEASVLDNSSPERVPLTQKKDRIFHEIASEVKSIDLDKDGVVTRAEIDRLITDGSITGARARAVAALKLFEKNESEEDISNTSKGINLSDLNHLLSLHTFLQSTNRKPDIALALLKEYKAQSNNDPKLLDMVLSLANDYIAAHGSKGKNSSTPANFNPDKLINNLHRLIELESCLNDIAARSEALEHFGRNLYGITNDASEAIKPEAVCQGIVGNCYLMATIISMADTQPQELAKMIEQIDEKSFSVAFPGQKPIIISMPSDIELLLYSGVTEHGIWPAVLEKAFGKFCKENPQFRKEASHGQVDQEGGEGGGTVEGIALLTGKKCEAIKDIAVSKQDQVWQLMRTSLHAKKIIIAGSGASAEAFFNEGKSSGLESRHAYAVLAVEDNTIILRNPHGALNPRDEGSLNKYGKMKGTFCLTKQEFFKFFNWLAMK